jgi:small subunit ribosomal protein S6
MNHYELIVILSPVLSDEESKKTIKAYTDSITEAQGVVVHEEAWGMRQLAYPIQKKTTGIYHLVQYQAPGDLNAKMEIAFRRDDNVIRHMITRLDKYAVEYAEKRRNGEIGKKKAAMVAEMDTPSSTPADAAADVAAEKAPEA